MNLTVTAILLKDCTRSCCYCIGGCNHNREGLLDTDALFEWLDVFAPNCNLHLSGGEPLMLSNIFDIAAESIERGHRTCIFTNGDLISKNLDLLRLPIVWHVTHHEPQPIDDFLKNVEPLKDKKHIITRVKRGRDALNNTREIESKYAGFNFHWSRLNSGRYIPSFRENKEHSQAVASDVIHLIEVDGKVYPCSTQKSGTIGNIHTMEYDKEKAKAMNEKASFCVKNNLCSAYQSAVLVDELHGESV